MISTSRKGISPLIAAVLLIAFTMSVAMMAGPWFSDIIKQQTSQTSNELNTVTTAADSSLEIEQLKYNQSSGEYTITVRNSGSRDIENLTFTITGEEIVQKDFNKELGKKKIETVYIETDNDTSKDRLSISAQNIPVSTEKDLTDGDIQNVGSKESNNDEDNSSPTAVFTVNTTSVEVGEVFKVDASGSTDNDGSLSSYEWDWTNDTTYESSGEVKTHVYSSEGDKTIKLRVTDDNNAKDTSTTEIEVTNSIVASSDLRARYTFENNGDTTTVNDVVGSYDGSNGNDPTYVSDSAQGSYALDYDGSDDYTSIPSEALDTSQEFTVTSWVNRDGYSNSNQKNARYISKGGEDNNAEFFFSGSSNSIKGSFSGNKAVTNENSENTWFHVAIKYQDGTGSIYIDGTEIDSTSYSGVDDGSNWYFGDGNIVSGNYYDGRLDDVRFYQTALSDAQIGEIYNNNN